MTPSNPTRKPKRTFALYLLILASLIIAWSGILRIQQISFYTSVIDAFDMRTMLPFWIGSGIVYTLLGLSTALTLFFHRWWAPWYAPAAFFLVTLLHWIERLLLTESQAVFVNTPFTILLNVFLFFGALVILAHPKQQRFFKITLNNPFTRKG